MTPAQFIQALQALGWVAQPASAVPQSAALPVSLPSELQALCAAHEGLHHAAQTAWFYSLGDYAGLAGSAFEWDFFERMSLDAAMSAHERQSVQQFWRAHVPFAASVAGDYAYLALRDDGAVVRGIGPEFEASAELLAHSLPQFFAQFIAHLNGQARDPRLLDFG